MRFLIVSVNLAIATVILFVAIKLISKTCDVVINKLNSANPRTLSYSKLGGFALALLIPLILQSNAYLLRSVIMAMIYVMLALSLNIIVGYAGQLSMGHSAFYGIGAYTTALLSVHFNLPFYLSMLISAVIAGVFGFLLGIPTLRLKGDYLAITTIGFSEIIRLILTNWIDLTRGPAGITGINPPSIFGEKLTSGMFFYYFALVLLILFAFISSRISNSFIGRNLKAVRDDETAAEAMGINPTKQKIFAFTLGSALAGVAGSFFALYIRYVNPDNFNYSESILILCMVVLGGLASIPGVVVGALLLSLLPEVLRDIEAYRYAIYGILLILMMIIRPQGIISEFALRGGGKVDGTTENK